ncbi:glycoside hydrolase family 125 protein [Ornithobacterium rhinotracheale]|uniref:glycoside hydrolase family 125 protein n=1 Tax=Ornithobacterium rhinotracheale TaxID=28251 RepID=UPI001FF6D9A1|nr:glycoside hydrolase family 125 protein [Ornithobacterium rhinotracheale]MCK0205931.1 glycoside hydrolase family 125 protein [Ornithobacterium rhinotracheale]
MQSRRTFIKNTMIGAVGLALMPNFVWAKGYPTKRPPLSQRKFTSPAVEQLIKQIKSQIKDEKLAWMFENCFPNTLDTTVSVGTLKGKPDTFVVTGDIEAMWLRDSAAQVYPYLSLVKKDPKLKKLIQGVIHRQTDCILIDPYANGFNKTALADKDNRWAQDTGMKPEIHERKWEIDSLCYPIRLAYNYWKQTGDTSVFDKDWHQAAKLIIKTFKEQQRKEDGKGPYSFLRVTDRQLDTVSNVGFGRPLKPVGLINSTFRPSDDNTTFGFLIPSNLFAVKSLRQMAEILTKVVHDNATAQEAKDLANEVEKAIQQYGIVNHPKYGKVYAYEVDGFGNHTYMDDPNVPSLLALPYLDLVSKDDPIYKNTRKLVWSTDNPYFFVGKAAQGIGSPHIGTYDMIWPMSLIMKGMTTDDPNEMFECLEVLKNTDANTGFIHETFNKDNPEKFTREWFAWANTLFGELVIKWVQAKK